MCLETPILAIYHPPKKKHAKRFDKTDGERAEGGGITAVVTVIHNDEMVYKMNHI